MTNDILYSAYHWAMKAKAYAQASSENFVFVRCCAETPPTPQTVYEVSLTASAEQSPTVTKGYVANAGFGRVANGVVVYSDKWLRYPYQTVVIPPEWIPGEQPSLVQHNGIAYRLNATFAPFVQDTWATKEAFTDWQGNTLYEAGCVVRESARYYRCVATHTSGEMFWNGFEYIPNIFEHNHAYLVGDKIRDWNGHKWVYYVCKTAYTSGAEDEIDALYWDNYDLPRYWIRTELAEWQEVTLNVWTYGGAHQNSLQAGDMFYCTDDHKAYTWNGTAWTDGVSIGDMQFVFDLNTNQLLHLFDGELKGIGRLE